MLASHNLPSSSSTELGARVVVGALLNDSASSLEQKGAGARWGAGLGVGLSASALGAPPNWP